MFDVEKYTNDCVNWIRDWFNGKEHKAIIGISGGVDSSTVAALCVKALGKKNVIGVKLPCGVQKDIDYSDELIDFLGIKSYTVNIGSAFEALTNEIRTVAENGEAFPNEQYSTNTPARIRMATLYGVSALTGGYVANTCNLSETAEGYDTIWGDSVGAFAPIARFTKTEVRAIAKHLGLPERLYNKVAIDGMSLNDDGSYKSDEDKLGFTYEELDETLRFGSINKNYDKIVNGMKKTAWKRKAIYIDYFEPELPFALNNLW